MSRVLIFLSVFIVLTACNQQKGTGPIKVGTIGELNKAFENAKAGDDIVMANGVWKDVEIVFYGEGTKEQPITLRAETAGEVTIEGASNMKLGGEYLVVKDLYFKNGYSPSKALIEFKINDTLIANNSRITNCVIDEFTQADRDVTDHWVGFWGRHNQLDHCYIAGKSNFGPTVRVFLKGNEHINNHHQIVNNHFGPRPRKGGPHGETLQIGDSYTSMTPSYTNVSNNLFERCNGEVEIISSKSNFNEFSHNVFFESEGSLVLRHGNYAKIDGNVFIGNDNSKFIGGIRVVNTGHWITNNYFYKIKGNEFRSALAVMNGVPKSPLNRYNQVTDVVVAHNTFIDCISPLQFSVGVNIDKKDVLPASEIRSERPERFVLANNLIYNQNKDNHPIKAYDKVDGVLFKNNILNSEDKSDVTAHGFITKDLQVDQISENLFVPNQNYEDVYHGFDFETITQDIFKSDRTKKNAIGAMVLPIKDNTVLMDKKLYGTDWFSNEAPEQNAETIKVASTDNFQDLLKRAKSGDILSLEPGTYKVNEALIIDKNITITSANVEQKAILQIATEVNAFELHPKGNLNIKNVVLIGDNTQKAFATLDKNMSKAYDLFVENSEISNFKTVLEVSKGSFADTISVVNTTIKNSLNGFLLNKETDSKGDYNAEFVLITNSTFDHVQNNVLNYYRGGYDESTIGGNLVLSNNTFTNSGKGSEILIENIGIVNVDISNNTFKNNPVKTIAVLWGEKGQKPVDNNIQNSGEIKIEQNLKQKLMY
ncbi:chondroitinase-B domain-containing protein [Mariniflexile ostreae]|uniref:Chondroitinase-B domain-containing protein n=1 Tax=Mariniflexile ostreae TaxID=1520892 RepID=A0ABV5FER3_9FLAO